MPIIELGELETYELVSDVDMGSDTNRKIISLVDLNLLSGSSDLLRQAAGGYFFNETDDDNNVQVPPPFYKFLPVDNANENIYSITSFTGDAVQKVIGSVTERGFGTQSDVEKGRFNQRTVIPNVKFITHIEGDPNNEILSDVTKGSKYWDCLFTGKQFNNNSVTPIYANGVYDDHYFVTSMPYTKIQKQLLVNLSDVAYVELSNDFNDYLRDYQTFTDNQESERTIPNFYAFAGAALGTRGGDDVNPNIVNYYTVGERLTRRQLFDIYRNELVGEDEDTDGGSYVTPMQKYLNNMLPISSSGISRQSLNYVNSRFANVIYNHNSARDYLMSRDITLKSGSMPFYNNITMPTHRSKKVAQLISVNQFSTDFMKSLKEIFLNQSPSELQTEPVEFLQNQQFNVPGDGQSYDNRYTTSNNTILKSVDLFDLILYSHNKIKDENEDFYIVDNKNLETDTAYDTKGTYRAYSSRNALRTLNKLLDSVTPAFYDGAIDITNINALLNSQKNNPPDFEVDNFNSLEPDSKNNEVLAYRVEKIGGAATGDSNTQNAIQNFWVFNSNDLKTLNLFDTQVKYNTPYTYKVYAYYAVQGFKYKFSNLQISRIIGSVREDGKDPESPIVGYCIEFYNPETGEVTTDMLEKSVYDDSLAEEIISSYASEAQRIAKSEASTSSTGVLPPYMANFITTIQPSYKVIEVPITQKVYRLLDNPPNDVNVVPTYALDNSNRIEFDLYYETFRHEPFPKAISTQDTEVKQQYLNAKDYISKTPLDHDTKSAPEQIQIFRLSRKPESFADFEGNEYDNVSLRIDGSEYTYTSCTYTDVVKSNVKYYYLFRSVNELGMYGDVNTVIEAELINDGGYKYAQFNVLFEEDLSVDIYKEKMEKLKNVLQLSPSLSQVTFDDSGVDYTQTAKSQYNKLVIGNSSNEELIWGQTFKIRLTSKKTGKKIDLNITYNDPDVKLEE